MMKRFLKYIIKNICSIVPQKKISAEIVSLSPNHLLDGRTALITGGTSGIGKAIAEAFLNAGANVIVTSRCREKVDVCAQQLSRHCGSGRAVYGVVLDTTNVDSFPSKLLDILSLPNIDKIDILVNNAGTNVGESYMCTGDAYDQILNTNLKGYFFLSRQIGEYMKKNNISGNILNVASASSLRPATSPYIISKWGVRGLTLGLAKKYIKNNIIVNGLAPGPTATPMLCKNDMDDVSLPNNPMGRFALPEEIANMAVVLTSQMGRLIVGDIIYMTGGAGVITYDDVNY